MANEQIQNRSSRAVTSRTDVESIIDNGGKLYIKNMSKPRAVIQIALFENNGRAIKCIIPAIPHPFNLSERYSKYSLTEGGSELKTIIRKGYLEIVDQKDAEKLINSDPEIEEQILAAEADATSNSQSVVSYKNARNSDNSDAPVIDSRTMPIKMEIRKLDGEEDNQTTNIMSNIRVLVEEVSGGGIDIKGAKLKLAEIKDQMTQEDFAYMIENTTGPIREYVQKMMVNQKQANKTKTEEE